ncbi:MAG: hypothetical protein QW764_02205 [Desulfurococcaceae archaeon]
MKRKKKTLNIFAECYLGLVVRIALPINKPTSSAATPTPIVKAGC